MSQDLESELRKLSDEELSLYFSALAEVLIPRIMARQPNDDIRARVSNTVHSLNSSFGRKEQSSGVSDRDLSYL